MAISIVRKRGLQAKKVAKESGLIHVLLRRPLPIPPAVLLLMIVFVWCSSTLLSISVFHVCVSSRKLNLYCITAGTRPDFYGDVVRGTYYNGSNIDNSSSSNNKSMDITIDKEVIKEEIAFVSNNNYAMNNDVLKDETAHVADGRNNATSNSSEDVIKEEIFYMANNSNSNPDVNKEEIAFAVKIVEEQMRALRSSMSKRRDLSNSCDGRGIFVYNLPPKFNADLMAQCHDMLPWVDFCEYLANEAMGQPITKLGERWYNSHQYSLELIFHSRVLKHPCRVYKEDEAKLFYVPYYGGLDILRWHFKNVTKSVKDELGFDLVRWLETQGYWVRNSGKDHVFVLGKISWDFRRGAEDSWGTQLLELDQMQNPLKLLIERQPWHVNDIGIPHPTHFHPHSDEDIIQWQSKIISSERKNLVSFAGGARPEASESIRSVLITQCSSSNGYCRFLDCKSGECSKPEAVIEMFMEAEFCLQPPGDSPTRKSVFDSLVSGCIPVIFDPFTAYYQYAWHLPEDHRRYSVYIDHEEVREMKVDVIERLKNVTRSDRDDMRRYIVYELMPGLVYGDSSAELHRFEDAFTISINNLVDRVSRSGL